jgi:hypothetical protein
MALLASKSTISGVTKAIILPTLRHSGAALFRVTPLQLIYFFFDWARRNNKWSKRKSKRIRPRNNRSLLSWLISTVINSGIKFCCTLLLFCVCWCYTMRGIGLVIAIRAMSVIIAPFYLKLWLRPKSKTESVGITFLLFSKKRAEKFCAASISVSQ